MFPKGEVHHFYLFDVVMNIYSMARKISIWGKNRGYYSSSEGEVIRYGLEVLLSQVITFIPIKKLSNPYKIRN